MQRVTNIRLIISLSILVGSTVLLFFLTGADSGSAVDKSMFQIESLDQIDHVVLESSKGKTDLRFNGTKWLVNERHEADRQMIKVLFATLKQTVAKRQVAAHLRDSLQKEIRAKGVNISCFAAGQLVSEIRTGGNAQKTETYFQTKDGAPYVVTIPGYRVYVASIFELAANDWRDKQIFNFNWQNIKSLAATFPSDPKQNFEASFQNKLFSIDGLATDTTKLDRFMDALFQLHAERILDSTEVTNYSDEVLQKPMMEIVIQDVANRAYPLAVFPPKSGSRYVAGKINKEVVLLNPLGLQEIVKKREYFVRH